jgi:IPTL-CTERM motif
MKKVRIAMVAIGIGAVTSAFAGANQMFVAPVSAPTLDEVGLGLLVVLLGVVGGLFARRKK